MTDEPVLTVHKYHGLGNDFLIALDPGGAEVLDAGLARRLCDRHRGVGADGLVHATGGAAGAAFRLWNADGSEAEMSGNGLRCMVHAMADAGALPGWGRGPVHLRVATPAGERAVTLRPGPTPSVAWGSVDMGEVRVAGSGERCNVGHGELRVDVGNPHLVVLGPDPATVDVAALGARLDGATPGGTNVEFVTLGPGPDEVTMRVWERGVGETQACGTGSCAAAAAVRHWGRVGDKVTVHQPGGSVEVELAGRPDGGWAAVLAGPSQRVATVRCRRADLAPGAALAAAG